MTNKVKPTDVSHSSSIEVGGSYDSSSNSAEVDGEFNEGKANRDSAATSIGSKAETFVPLCPKPVRIAVGVFSGLLAVGGCVMSVIGFDRIFDTPNQDHALQYGLIGGGIAMIGSAGIGAWSIFAEQKQLQPSATHA